MKPEKIRSTQLYVITDRRFARGRLLTGIVAQAIAGGAGVIQLRDKESSAKELVQTGLALRNVTCKTGTLFIVNDRVDVAMVVDADGAHLGQDDLPPIYARRIMGSKKIIGVSVGSVAEAIQAVADSADYISVGSIFPTQTKPDAGGAVGTQLITQIKNAVDIPVVAIGGITADNIAQVAEAGADCVAVISAVVGADDVETAARCLIQKFRIRVKREA